MHFENPFFNVLAIPAADGHSDCYSVERPDPKTWQIGSSQRHGPFSGYPRYRGSKYTRCLKKRPSCREPQLLTESETMWQTTNLTAAAGAKESCLDRRVGVAPTAPTPLQRDQCTGCKSLTRDVEEIAEQTHSPGVCMDRPKARYVTRLLGLQHAEHSRLRSFMLQATAPQIKTLRALSLERQQRAEGSCKDEHLGGLKS